MKSSPNFRIGQRVFLVQSKAEGIIVSFDGKDLMYVNVNGDQIPVFTEDVSADFPKEEKVQTEKVFSPQSFIQDFSGVSLCLLPSSNKEGDMENFSVLMVNATAIDFEMEGNIQFNTFSKNLKKTFLQKQTVIEIHQFAFDELNEQPQFEFSFSNIGKIVYSKKFIQKIKAKSFYNKEATIPLLNQKGFVYTLFSDWLKTAAPHQIETAAPLSPDDLKKLMLDVPQKKNENAIPVVPLLEIDLHIEQLTNNHKHLSNAEIIQIQLQAFQKAIDKSIVQHNRILYVIHGVGSGKLKKEVHILLKENKFVVSFENKFHPRYGHGATEVVLKN